MASKLPRTKRGANLIKQKKFLVALVANWNNITRACAASKISRKQVYNWRKKDVRFQKAMKRVLKTLEENLFQQACQMGLAGDTTLIIFTLKSLNRARFDDGFIKQKYAMDRGASPNGEVTVPVRVALEREPMPGAVEVDKEKIETEH